MKSHLFQLNRYLAPPPGFECPRCPALVADEIVTA
jgi:hypothetical protein